MANGRYYWLKLKRDFFKRHDIRIIESMPNGKDYILFYLKLLCESVDHEGSLRFSEEIPYNEEMLATITNTDIDVVRTAVKVFAQLGMMEMLDDGTLFMNEVQKMIGSAANNDNANRQRRYRERQKLLSENALVTESVTKNNESKSKNKSKSKDIYKDVPAELKDSFMEWADMRKTIKKPITTKTTVTRALNKLNSLAKTTEEKIALIELATDRCWQSFYLPRESEAPKEVKPRAYKEFEKEDYEREDFVPDQMPDEIRQRLDGMFGG